MILLDTNIVVDAQNRSSPFYKSSQQIIRDALSGDGAAINAVIFAELCAGRPEAIDDLKAELEDALIGLFDLPSQAAPICGAAYSRYRSARRRSRGGAAPTIPLPDFFIGAHAELMGWSLATRDTERYRRYFPNVQLIEPRSVKR
jgi:predicted nucleic acid-binding protein